MGNLNSVVEDRAAVDACIAESSSINIDARAEVDSIFDDYAPGVRDAIMVVFEIVGVTKTFFADDGVGIDLAVCADVTRMSDVNKWMKHRSRTDLRARFYDRVRADHRVVFDDHIFGNNRVRPDANAGAKLRIGVNDRRRVNEVFEISVDVGS